MASDIKQINKFLTKVNNVLNKPNSFQLIRRRKNLDAIYRMGLSIDSVKKYIKNLTHKDYHKGPEKDDNVKFPGDVWFFGKRIDGVLFYIKLKIKNDHLLCCLSFHDAKYDIYFPYK